MPRLANLAKQNPALLATLAAAAAVRFYGISFGLPDTEARPDESSIVFMAVRAISEGPAPASLVYPTLYTYLLSAAYIAYSLIQLLLGHYHVFPGDLLTEYAANPQTLFLINRLLAASFGVLTVLTVYKISQNLFGRETAALAALFMAFCHLHARDSHFGTLDVPMTFFIALCVLLIIKARQSGSLKHYLLAGIAAGFATGTKYAGILLLGNMFFVYLLNFRSDRTLHLKAAAFGLAMLGAFLVSTPYAALNFHQLIADYNYHKNLHGVMHGHSLWRHVNFSLAHGMGQPLLAASIAGLVLLAFKDLGGLAQYFAFLFLYAVMVSRVSSIYARYTIPMLPFLCVSAAYCARAIAQRIANRAVYAAFILALMLPSAYDAAMTDILLGKADNRTIAARWIYQNIPKGSVIAMPESEYAGPRLNWETSGEPPSEMDVFKQKVYRAAAVWRSANNAIEYKRAFFDKLNKKFVLASGKQTEPDWIILAEPVLGNTIYAGTLDEVAANYAPAAAFKAREPNTPAQYDDADSFYLPFHKFTGVRRAGPNIYIFKKR